MQNRILKNLLALILLTLGNGFFLFLLADINLVLAVVVTLVVYMYLYIWLDRHPVSLLLLLISFAFSLSSLHMAVRDNTRQQRCFEFNSSYPGTEKYDECVSLLTFYDYVPELKFISKVL